MNNDLVIQIKHVMTNEIISLTLNHKVANRFQELSDKLKVFDMWFGDETWLYITDNKTNQDVHVAMLISDSNELTSWLTHEQP